MATVVGTVKGVSMVRGDDTVTSTDTTSTDLFGCYLYGDLGGLAETSGDTVTLAAVTAIQNARRNGKTVTLRSVALAINAYDQTANVIIAAKTVQISSSLITFIPTTGDYSTGYTVAASDVLSRPWAFFIAFTEA